MFSVFPIRERPFWELWDQHLTAVKGVNAWGKSYADEGSAGLRFEASFPSPFESPGGDAHLKNKKGEFLLAFGKERRTQK